MSGMYLLPLKEEWKAISRLHQTINQAPYLVSIRECPLGILNLHPQLLDGPHVLPSLFYKQKK